MSSVEHFDLNRNILKEIHEASTDRMKQQFSPLLETQWKVKEDVFKITAEESFTLGNLRQKDGSYKMVRVISLADIEGKIKAADRINSPTLLQVCIAVTAVAGGIFFIIGAGLGLVGLALPALIVTSCAAFCKLAVLFMAILNICPKRKRDKALKEIINDLAQQHVIHAQNTIIRVQNPHHPDRTVHWAQPYKDQSHVYKVFEIFSKEGSTAKAVAAIEAYYKLTPFDHERNRSVVELRRLWNKKPAQAIAA